ncbi:MAG: hypothetical protein JOZ90_11495 [Alphaproteobacteria bacterium]|nr:hypothetical protein [Alphaproteobacteria bacterium]MBV9372016.1 hypothetical protein [Alphaproteobacteria bacterium]MBV9901710.1 hypothetical protein [Alphaproteobacteria bacterium]
MKRSASQLAAGETPPVAAPEELVYLLGQPHLSDYLDFVRDKAVGGAELSQRALADEWRKANDLYYALEQAEAGAADGAQCLPLPAAMRPLARRLARDRYFRDTYDTLPTQIRMVELGRLVVSQSSVSAEFSAELRRRLHPGMPEEELFRFCLPTDRPHPAVRARRVSSERWLFTCDSTDFRLHRAQLLKPARVKDLRTFGPVSDILALMVGFGSNFMSVVRSEERLLLQNGYHRAYTLLAAGVTHAPAVVQTVTRKDELKIAANEDVCEDPAFYFRAARPPLLRDFLDPRFGKRLLVQRMQTSIEIEIKTRTSTGYLV